MWPRDGSPNSSSLSFNLYSMHTWSSLNQVLVSLHSAREKRSQNRTCMYKEDQTKHLESFVKFELSTLKLQKCKMSKKYYSAVHKNKFKVLYYTEATKFVQFKAVF